MSTRERRSALEMSPDWPSRDERDGLSEHRETVVHALGLHFAQDDLGMDDLERRLALAFKATTSSALEALLADLPPLVSDEPGNVPRRIAAAPRGTTPERGILVAVMGGTGRKGGWYVPRHLKVFAIMGGVEIDLRQAHLPPGVVEIDVFALMGGVEVIVPPGVRVEAVGMAVMGGFEANTGDESVVGQDQPVIRLTGLALMAGVEARVKRPSTKALTKFEKALRAARSRVEDERG